MGGQLGLEKVDARQRLVLKTKQDGRKAEIKVLEEDGSSQSHLPCKVGPGRQNSRKVPG